MRAWLNDVEFLTRTGRYIARSGRAFNFCSEPIWQHPDFWPAPFDFDLIRGKTDIEGYLDVKIH